MREQQPDIVCLQETKAQEHQLPPEALDHARVPHRLRRRRKERLQRRCDLCPPRARPHRARPRDAGIRRRGPLRADGLRRRLLGRVALRSLGHERAGAPSRQGSLPRPLHRAARADEERRPPLRDLRRLQHRASRHRRLRSEVVLARDRILAARTRLVRRRHRPRRLGRCVSRRQPRAAAVLVVVELSGRVDAQSRLAHRLPARHPEPCAGRARGVDLQGRAVLRPRARSRSTTSSESLLGRIEDVP